MSGLNFMFFQNNIASFGIVDVLMDFFVNVINSFVLFKDLEQGIFQSSPFSIPIVRTLMTFINTFSVKIIGACFFLALLVSFLSLSQKDKALVKDVFGKLLLLSLFFLSYKPLIELCLWFVSKISTAFIYMTGYDKVADVLYLMIFNDSGFYGLLDTLVGLLNLFYMFLLYWNFFVIKIILVGMTVSLPLYIIFIFFPLMTNVSKNIIGIIVTIFNVSILQGLFLTIGHFMDFGFFNSFKELIILWLIGAVIPKMVVNKFKSIFN